LDGLVGFHTNAVVCGAGPAKAGDRNDTATIRRTSSREMNLVVLLATVRRMAAWMISPSAIH
jgi:hypothetical protein